MATTNVFIKDPSAVLDYVFDWSTWLADGETIASHTVTAQDGGPTVDSSSEAVGKVTVWISGGAIKADYSVTCQITTSAGRTDERSIIVQIRDR